MKFTSQSVEFDRARDIDLAQHASHPKNNPKLEQKGGTEGKRGERKIIGTLQSIRQALVNWLFVKNERPILYIENANTNTRTNATKNSLFLCFLRPSL